MKYEIFKNATFSDWWVGCRPHMTFKRFPTWREAMDYVLANSEKIKK